MNSRLVYIRFWFIFALWNVLCWKKSKDKDLLWYLAVGIIGLVAELIYEYLILSSAPQQTLSMANTVFYVFDRIGAIVFIWVIIRRLIKSGHKSDRDPHSH